MILNYKNVSLRQAGFSLVEILVGLVIGLLATLVIMQVFSVFEGQKRSTSGSADAQTNGSIALMNIQRDLQMAGYGLPPLMIELGPDKFSSLLCDPFPDYDHDNNPATSGINLSPIVILDGVANANDAVIVRYSSTASTGGVPVKIINTTNATLAAGLSVDNNIGCKDKDIVLVSNATACAMTKIADPDLVPPIPNPIPDPIHISLDVNTPLVGPLTPGVTNSRLACMGNWQDYRYDVVNNELRLNGTPIVTEVLNLQAQYGVSAASNSNQVNQWVNATGAWAAPTVADRNRIRAVRIVVVVRNGLREKENVTNTCITNKGTINNGPCAWDDTDYSAAPMIDLSADVDWQKYRYRAFETIVPLRNMIWSKDTL